MGSTKRKAEEITTKKKKVESSSSSSESSSSSSSDSESEDEKPVTKKLPVKAAPAPAPAKKVPAKKAESSSSDSSDSESEDEKPAAKKVAPAAKAAPAPAPAKKVPAKKAESSSSDSSSSSSSSSDSESEDEKPAAKKAKTATPAAKAKSAPATPASPGGTNSENGLKIFVKGLPWNTTEAEVKDYFKGCGSIVSCELPTQADGRSSGTAYVVFSKRPEVDKALEMDGSTWPGTERWLKIEEGKERAPRASTSGGVRPEGCDTVFVGNLPWDVSEEQLRELFGGCGDINQVRFATGEDGGFRGFGHVQFTTGEACDEAIKLAGSDVNGRGIRIDYAPPRAPRQSFGGGDSPRGGGRGNGGGFSPRGGGRDGGRGRGRDGGRDGGRGRGGRDGGRGGFVNKNKGSIVPNAGGKKMTFDDE